MFKRKRNLKFSLDGVTAETIMNTIILVLCNILRSWTACGRNNFTSSAERRTKRYPQEWARSYLWRQIESFVLSIFIFIYYMRRKLIIGQLGIIFFIVFSPASREIHIRDYRISVSASAELPHPHPYQSSDKLNIRIRIRIRNYD